MLKHVSAAGYLYLLLSIPGLLFLIKALISRRRSRFYHGDNTPRYFKDVLFFFFFKSSKIWLICSSSLFGLFLRCGSQAQSAGSVSWCSGWAAPRQVGSSWTRVRTRVSCTGRWILYHWATRVAPPRYFKTFLLLKIWKIKSIQRVKIICEITSKRELLLAFWCLSFFSYYQVYFLT